MEFGPRIHDHGDEAVPTIHVPARYLGDFWSEALISEVSNGRVNFATLNNGEIVVVKKLHVSTGADSNDEFLSKVSRVSTLKHDNLVKLCGHYVEGNTRILAYEYAKMGSLHDILHCKKGVHGAQPETVLNWLQRVRIAYDVAKGLMYLHESLFPFIILGDFRSSNVLLFEGLSAKISGSNILNQAPNLRASLRLTGVSGTGGYHAPEFAVTGPTHKSDVYSFGVVLLELLTGRKPDDDTLPQGQESLITWATPMLTKDKVKHCVDPSLKGEETVAQLAALAALCLDNVPRNRPNMMIPVMSLKMLLKYLLNPINSKRSKRKFSKID
ncbi:PTI1-like tyrosine-protein kinase 3 [Rutidosis leptorrhynchoides]|uniref:PTI1-like tyrosine-protein kinase 3 n=1 Tax=Rutidosis leptorrhynchoides TaxID=125765 RepID=UPI003A9905B4